MSFEIQYPLFLIPHGGGYLSIVDPDSPAEQMLVVCSNEELFLQLLYQFEIMSSPKKLLNDREFAWLLKYVKPPVTKVAFDPRPIGADVNAAEVVSIATLLGERLKPDLSPWNYPVFAIAEDEGFISITSDDGAGGVMTLLTMFTSKELAMEYLEKTNQQGTLCRLADVGQARTFLSSIDSSFAVAVALDPVVDGEFQSSKYCFSIDVLLEKYLVIQNA
jgi:hypothetical protein